MSEINQTDPVVPVPIVTPTPTSDGSERTEELVGKMLDESLDDQEVAELEQLLSANSAARSIYVSYVQLHNELLDMFSEGAAPRPALAGLEMPVPVPELGGE